MWTNQYHIWTLHHVGLSFFSRVTNNMFSLESENIMERMWLDDGLSSTQQGQLGSIMVGHRVKRSNGFHLLLSTQYIIPSFEEKYYPRQILSHHIFPRKISTSAESEADRHAEQIQCEQRCV